MSEKPAFIEFAEFIANTDDMNDSFMYLLDNCEECKANAISMNKNEMAEVYENLAPVFTKMSRKQKNAMVKIFENSYFEKLSYIFEYIENTDEIVIGERNETLEITPVHYFGGYVEDARVNKNTVAFNEIFNRKEHIIISGDSEEFCSNDDYVNFFKQLRSISEEDFTFDIIDNSEKGKVNIRLVSEGIYVDFIKELDSDWLDEKIIQFLSSFVREINNKNDKRYVFIYPEGRFNSGQEYDITYIGYDLFAELSRNNYTSFDEIEVTTFFASKNRNK